MKGKNKEDMKKSFRKIIAVFLTVAMIINVNSIFTSAEDTASEGTRGQEAVKISGDYVKGQVLIQYKESVNDNIISDVVDDVDGEITETTELDNTEVACVELSPDTSVEEAISELKNDKHVLHVQPNYLYKTYDTEKPINDPGYNDQYHLRYNDSEKGANVEKAWQFIKEKNITMNNVKIGVVDSGVDIDHPDLTDIVNKDESAEVCIPDYQAVKYDGKFYKMLGDGDFTGALYINQSLFIKLNNQIIQENEENGKDGRTEKTNPPAVPAWDDTFTFGIKTIENYNYLVSNYNLWAYDYNSKVLSGGMKLEYLDDIHGEYHGTHVTGIIAAKSNNNQYGSGVATLGNNEYVDVVDVDTMDAGRGCTTFASVVAMLYAMNAKCKVINCSWGGPQEDDDIILDKVCEECYKLGITVIAAAGNDGKVVKSAPASYEKNISVINTTKQGQKAPSSTYGQWYTLCAPGSDIYSTLPSTGSLSRTFISNKDKDPNYGALTGTSMATPVVTGIAAMCFGVNPNLTPDQMKQIMTSTARDLNTPGFDNETGYGLIDAEACVKKAYDMLENPAPKFDNTFDANGGSFSGETTKTFNVEENQDITIPIPTRTGYKLAGWYGTPACDGSKLISENTTTVKGKNVKTTYYAKWTPIWYTVRFLSTTASNLPQQKMTYDVPQNLYRVDGELNLTNEYYNFAGWSKAFYGTTVDYTDGQSVVNLSSEEYDRVNLYAVWAKLKTNYKVEHYVQRLNAQENDIIGNAQNNTNYELKDTDTDPGYSGDVPLISLHNYAGFTDETGATRDKIKKDGSSTYKCYYGRNKYKLTFNQGAHGNWSQNSVSQDVYYESKLAGFIPDDYQKAQTGYKFKSWDSAILDKMGTSDLTYTANWDPIKYKVRFNANNGTGTMQDQEMTYDTSATLNDNKFTRKNYRFLGWSTNSAAQRADYTNLASVRNLTSRDGDTVNFYAIWELKSASYKVEHYKQKLNSNQDDILGTAHNTTNYELVSSDTQTINASAGSTTKAQSKTYKGFTPGAFSQEEVKEDGTTVIKIYYDRNQNNLTFNQGLHGNWNLSPVIHSVYYGCKISGFIPKDYQTAASGYRFSSWDKTLATTMGESDLTYTARWESIQSDTKPKYIRNNGMCYVARNGYYDVGIAYSTDDDAPEFRWMQYDLTKKEWTIISDWSNSNWAQWKTERGDYWLQCEMRTSDGKGADSKIIAFHYAFDDFGTYAGWTNGGVLLGCNSTISEVSYYFKIYNIDKQTWQWGSKQKSPWATWNAVKGNYWTHFEVYSKDGRLIGQKTHCFAV